MTRKLILAAFLLTVVLTVVAAHHQLTNAAPNMARPPQVAPPLEQYAAQLASATAPGDPVWQVVAGGGGKYVELNDVSMASPDEGWAVGHTVPSSYGVLMHYTGTTWSQVTAPGVPTATYAINTVAMISSTEGWAAGYVACPWGQCDQGLLMHYTHDAGWQKVALPPKPGGAYWNGFYSIDIKGSAGWISGDYDHDWASGTYTNYLLQFNGTSWTPTTTLLSSLVGYVSVIGANEAWATGGSNLVHFSGGSWSVVTPTMPAGSSLGAIHMLSASEGWAVGHTRSGTYPNYSYQCLTLHYNGSDWSQVSCPADDVVLYSVYMRTPTDGWAVGRTVQHFSSSTSPRATGTAILRYNGSAWSMASTPSDVGGLSSVELVGADDGWAVGDNKILHLVNGNWTTEQTTSLSVAPLNSIANDEVWWGGSGGKLYQWENGTIITHTSPLTGTITSLRMFSSTLGWASTYDRDSRTGNIIEYSTGEWNVTAILSDVTSISMVGPSEGWFATRKYTNSGGFLYYKDGVWKGQSVPGNYGVSSVSMIDPNHGWAAGGGYDFSAAWSRVYTYTGTMWRIATPSPVITGEHGNLKIIGISPDEAWVAGYAASCTTTSCPASPQLHHFSAGTWTSISMPDWLAFLDISKVSATEWWAAGKLTTMNHAFLHYKDGVYSTVPAAGEDVLGVSMLPDGTGFACGAGSLLKLVVPVTVTVDSGTSAAIVFTGTQATTTTVSVPAGAVTNVTTIVYTPLYTATTPDGFSFAGHAFDLDAYQGGTLLPGFAFSKPVTITIHYSEGDVAGLDENSLTLRYWNGSAWASDGISVVERNTTQNYVVFTVTHLSEFALFGSESAKYKVYLPLVIR